VRLVVSENRFRRSRRLLQPLWQSRQRILTRGFIGLNMRDAAYRRLRFGTTAMLIPDMASTL
jgi:hypothetical protein